ncbi:hypothetical protein F8388_025785 [Cannabis sativa]|uniref:Uncharacterized protein n=1 Tax=Cannabis sativa TaxID=3483 RepID=A0A7J6F9F3_CANSA|nr:hypothetical protein F8388_025785 [Cannabis sativa]
MTGPGFGRKQLGFILRLGPKPKTILNQKRVCSQTRSPLLSSFFFFFFLFSWSPFPNLYIHNSHFNSLKSENFS